jgi:hypothetical protein
MPTRADVPNVANQAKQALMPVEELVNRRTSSAWATSNQRRDTGSERLTMIRSLQHGGKLAKERADLSGHPGACRLGRQAVAPSLVVSCERGPWASVPRSMSYRRRSQAHAAAVCHFQGE